MSDPFSVLGVSRDATDEQVKAAFRNLAKQHHPDANPGDASAEARFKEINSAYESVKTADKRAALNNPGPRFQGFRPGGAQMHPGGFEFSWGGPGMPPNMEEILREMHRAQTVRNRHYTAQCAIGMMEAFRGCEVSLKLEEKEIRLKVPPGVDNGTRIRVQGAGENVHPENPPGDLYVTIMIRPDLPFGRDGKFLFSTVDVDAIDAILGAKIKVQTIDGDTIEMEANPGIQNGHQMRISGRGMPIIGSDARGDHVVTINIKTNTGLTDRQMELLREIKSLSN